MDPACVVEPPPWPLGLLPEANLWEEGAALLPLPQSQRLL